MRVYIDPISSNLSVYIALAVGVVVFFGGLAIINNSIDFGVGERNCVSLLTTLT